MSEPENIDRVVAALLKVPEKKLLIIQLVNSIPIKNGELDYITLANKQLEINLAIQESKVYGAHTAQAVESLARLRAKEEDEDLGFAEPD
jgi:hypothetical protein